MSSTEDEVYRVMTPIIGWPRLDAWLDEVRAEARKEAGGEARPLRGVVHRDAVTGRYRPAKERRP